LGAHALVSLTNGWRTGSAPAGPPVYVSPSAHKESVPPQKLLVCLRGKESGRMKNLLRPPGRMVSVRFAHLSRMYVGLFGVVLGYILQIRSTLEAGLAVRLIDRLTLGAFTKTIRHLPFLLAYHSQRPTLSMYSHCFSIGSVLGTPATLTHRPLKERNAPCVG